MKRLFATLALAAFAVFALAQSNPNTSTVLLPSAARTAATVNSADQNNFSWRCLHAIVNVSAYTSGAYTPHIQAAIPATPTVYYDILVATPSITATGVTVLKVCPDGVPLTGASAADFLPRVWRVQMIGTATPSMTFSVSGYLGN